MTVKRIFYLTMAFSKAYDGNANINLCRPINSNAMPINLRRVSSLIPKAEEAKTSLSQALGDIRQIEDEESAREFLRKAMAAIKEEDLSEQPMELLQSAAEACIDLGLMEEADRITSTLLEQHPCQTRSSIFRAKLMETQGDFRESARILEDMLHNEPGNGMLYMELGKALIQTGDTIRAREVLRKAVENDSQLLEAYDLLIKIGDSLHWKAHKALALLDRGDIEGAKPLVSLKQKDASDPVVLMALAEISRTQGDVELARELTNRVQSMDTRDPHQMLSAAYRLARAGLLDESIVLYRRILDHDPYNSRAWYGIGSANFYMNRFEASLEAVRKSLEIEPDLKAAKVMLIKDLGSLRRSKEAVDEAVDYLQDCKDDDIRMEIIEALVRYCPGDDTAGVINNMIEVRGDDPSLLALRVENLISQMRINDGLRNLESALKTYPKDSRLRHLKAKTLWDMGDSKKARKDLESVLSRDPRHMPSLLLMLEVHKADKSYPEVIQVADRILSIQPRNIDVTKDKAVTLDAMGMHQDAIRTFRQALSWGTRDIQQANEVLAALLGSDRFQDALELADAVLERQDHDSMFWRLRGNALYALERYTEAKDSYAQGLEIDPDDQWLWFSKGMSQERLGRYREAIECYDRAIVRDLENVEFWMSKALCLESLNLNVEALKCLDQVLRVKGGHRFALLHKGLLLAEMGRIEEALFYFNKGNEVTRNDPKILGYLKDCHMRLGNNEELVEVTRKLLRINPESVKDMLDLGKALQALENDTEALQYFDMALELRPADRSIIEMKRTSVRRSGDPDSLRKLLQDVLKADPLDRGARMELAELHIRTGNHSDAIRVIDDLDVLKDDPQSQMLKGDALQALGRYEEAVQSYNRSLETLPNNVQVIIKLAKALSAQGRFDEALKRLDEAIFLEPLNYGSQWLKVRILKESGRREEAKAPLKRLFELDPRDKEVWMEAATLWEELGDRHAAVRSLNKAIANGAEGLHLRLAENQLAIGEEEEALESLLFATKYDPRSQRAWSLLGAQQFKAGMTSQAKVSLQKAIRFDPQDRQAILTLADLESSLDKKSKAMANYDKAFALDNKDPYPMRRKAKLQTALRQLENAMMSWQTVLTLNPGDVEAREGIEEIKRLQDEAAAAAAAKQKTQ